MLEPPRPEGRHGGLEGPGFNVRGEQDEPPRRGGAKTGAPGPRSALSGLSTLALRALIVLVRTCVSARSARIDNPDPGRGSERLNLGSRARSFRTRRCRDCRRGRFGRSPVIVHKNHERPKWPRRQSRPRQARNGGSGLGVSATWRFIRCPAWPRGKVEHLQGPPILADGQSGDLP